MRQQHGSERAENRGVGSDERWVGILSRRAVGLGITVGLVLSLPSPGVAATFVVNHTGDVVDANPGNGVCDIGGGDCTLRAAIQEANALAGTDTIQFFLPGQVHALGINGYDNTAAAGDLDITDSLEIQGNGAFVDAQFLTSVDNVLDVRNGVDVDIFDLTVQGGSTGIFVTDSVVHLTGCTTRQNAHGVFLSAAFMGSASLIASGTIVTDNSSYGIRGQGPTAVSLSAASAVTLNASGIWLDGGNGAPSLSLSDSSVTNNNGSANTGGIHFTCSFWGPSTLTVDGSEIRDNSTSAASGVGGLRVAPGSSGGPDPTVTITDSIFEGNSGQSTGGFAGFGNVTILDSLFEGNQATGGFTPAPGGVSLSVGVTAGPPAEIHRSTFVGNSGQSGALVTQQPLEMTNSTFTGNTATHLNAAVVTCRTTWSTCDFDHITIADSAGSGGSGLYGEAPATVSLGHSVLSGAAVWDCLGGIASTGYNLIESVGCGISGDTTGNLSGVDPLLEALADNGGSTPTRALGAGSPALDAGAATCLPTSQNGVARPADGDGDSTALCDMGAFELPAPTLDFGDAPDPLVGTPGEYPTLLANDGARHTIVSGVHLGAAIDDEPDGLSSADATGDDADGADDEDGVVFTSLLVPGAMAGVEVTASVAGFVHAWIDFDQNGVWNTSEEEVLDGVAVAAGSNGLSFAVPTGAAPGGTFARFRFDTGGTAGLPTGAAPDGEVEDYLVSIEPVADLGVSLAGPSDVAPGEPISYTLVASNPSGPAGVVGAVVTDDLPGDLVGCTWTCAGSGGGACDVPSGTGDLLETVDLPVGGSATFGISCVVDSSAIGSVGNQASIAPPSGIVDPNASNDVSSVMTTLTPSADLSVTNSDGVGVIEPPDTLTYTIEVTNLGPSDVASATVTDLFPVLVTDVSWTCSATGGGFCAPSGLGDLSEAVDLPVGATVTFLATGDVDDGAPAVLVNTASVSSSTSDPQPANDSATDETELAPEGTVVFTGGFESGDLLDWSFVVDP